MVIKTQHKKNLFPRQENSEGGALSFLGADLDPPTLHHDNLSGQIQANADAVRIMYLLLAVKPFENHPLPALWDSLTAVRNVDPHMQFPALDTYTNPSAIQGILNGVVQDIEQRLACPFAVM